MSLTPLNLQNAFASITKARVPEAVMRGRQFEAAITRLAEWWSSNFEIEPTGHIRSRTFADVQKLVIVPDPSGKGKGRAVDLTLDDDDDEDAELIRSEKSLMKHALQKRGSRDVSAQLFTALCRALDIPARLVVSLQSVPWQAAIGKPKAPTKKKAKTTPDAGKGKGKGKAKAAASDAEEDDSDTDEDDDMEEVSIPADGGQRIDGKTPSPNNAPAKKKVPPVIRLRKSKPPKRSTAPVKQQRKYCENPLQMTVSAMCGLSLILTD